MSRFPMVLLLALLVFLGGNSPIFAQSELGDQAGELAGLVEAYRLSLDLAPLVSDLEIQRSAQDYAQDLARRGILSHRDTRGAAAGDRLAERRVFGVVGEILGAGPDAASIFAAWLNSPGHKRALTDPRWKKWGLGLVRSSGPLVAVVLFLR